MTDELFNLLYGPNKKHRKKKHPYGHSLKSIKEPTISELRSANRDVAEFNFEVKQGWWPLYAPSSQNKQLR